MKLLVNESSEKRSRRHDLPTPFEGRGKVLIEVVEREMEKVEIEHLKKRVFSFFSLCFLLLSSYPNPRSAGA